MSVPSASSKPFANLFDIRYDSPNQKKEEEAFLPSYKASFSANGLNPLSVQTFLVDNQRYKICKTKPDGACGLHALLGTEVAGDYFCEGARELYITKLMADLKKPEVETLLNESLVSYLKEYIKYGNRASIYLKMIFSSLDNQIQAVNLVLNDLLQKENKLKQLQIDAFSVVLDQVNKLGTEHEQKLFRILCCSDRNALRQNLNYYYNVKNAVHTFLGDSSEGQKLRLISDQLAALNKEREDLYLATIKKPEFLQAYFSACLNQKGNYYFTDEDLQICALLFRKKVRLYTEDFTLTHTFDRGESEWIVIFHSKSANHYSRCVKHIDATAQDKPVDNQQSPSNTSVNKTGQVAHNQLSSPSSAALNNPSPLNPTSPVKVVSVNIQPSESPSITKTVSPSSAAATSSVAKTPSPVAKVDLVKSAALNVVASKPAPPPAPPMPFPRYSEEFAKTDRAEKILKFLRSREFNKISPYLCSLSEKKRLNYEKHGETLFTFTLKAAIPLLSPRDVLIVIEQFHLAASDLRQTDGKGITPLQIVQASRYSAPEKENLVNILQNFSSEYFWMSAEYSNSKKATKLQGFVDERKFHDLGIFLMGLNREGRLNYVKNGETLFNHFLKGSIHSRPVKDILLVLEEFNRANYSFTLSDQQGLVPIHIVLCSSIPIPDKKIILGWLLHYKGSCEYNYKGTTALQTVINNLSVSDKSEEWLDLLLCLFNYGADPDYGRIHPLTYAMTNISNAAIKSKLLSHFLEVDVNETATGSDKNSQTPLKMAMSELLDTKDDESFSTVFQYVFPLIMKDIDKPEKQAILSSEIRTAISKDSKITTKIIRGIYSKIDEKQHHFFYKILAPVVLKTWLETFFKDSKSELVINDLAKARELSPHMFKAVRMYANFSEETVLENLRAVDRAKLSDVQKSLIGHVIVQMGVPPSLPTVELFLFNIENVIGYFGEGFILKVLPLLMHLKPIPPLHFLNGILTRLTDLDRKEDKDFSTQNEIITVLKAPISEWTAKLDNLAVRIYYSKYPEKPLDEVLANFRKMEFPLSEKELQDLGNSYKQILNYSREKKVQDYSPKDIATALKTLSSFPETLNADIKSNSPKSNYDRLTVCMSLIRQAIYKSEGYLPYNTQVLVVLALLKYNGKGRLAQVNTGQGKSVIVAMQAAYFSLLGQSVDVVTTSDTLAIRDAEGKAAFYKILGLTVKHNCLEEQTHEACYKGAHVVYGTPYRFESAILHDLYTDTIVRGNRKFDVVLVDEVDSMFLDKGSHSTRLIFGDSRFDGLFWVHYEILGYVKANKNVTVEEVTKALSNSEYYPLSTDFVKEKIKTNVPAWVDSAKTALYYYAENKHYVVREDKVLPVDFKHTGALEDNTRYSKGLHQFLEIKHKIVSRAEKNVGCCISHVSFFLRYNKILGLSGSLGGDAERSELSKSFNLDTFDVPSHKEGTRTHFKPIFTKDKSEWFQAIKADTIKQIRLGRAVLILFETIQQTIDFKAYLNYARATLLNGSQTIPEEDKIVSQAGMPQTVTIATNKAGRGMDIRTSPQTDSAGGLHVILGFFPLNRRVRKQAEGRTARLDKSGTVQMILNLINEDLEDVAQLNDTQKIELLQTIRNNNEVELSKERLEVIIPTAKHIDALVLDFCSRLAVLKQKYNKHEVKAFKERWAEWLSQIDDSDLNKENIEKWKTSTTSKYRILLETLYKDLDGGSIIQNPDIFVSWGNELKGQASIDKYSSAIRLDPGHAVAYLRRGFEYKAAYPGLAINDFKKAVLYFTGYIKLNPTNSSYFEGRASANNELKNFQNVAEDYSKALELDRGNLSAYLGRADALGKLNQWDDAIRDYKNAIQSSRKQTMTDEWRTNIFRRAAIGLQGAKNFPDALSTALEALQFPIKDSYSLYRLNDIVGSIYTDNFNDAKRGIAYHQKALDARPDDLLVRVTVARQYYNLGIDYSAENNDLEAIIQYCKAEKLAGNNPQLLCKIYNNMAACWKRKGQIEHAIKNFKLAIAADPTNLNPKNALARLYLEQGTNADEINQSDNALAWYKLAEGIMTDQDDLYNLYNNTGVSYKKKQEYASAINYYEAAIKLKPNEELARKNLAYTLCRVACSQNEAGHYNDALNSCIKGLNLGLDDKFINSDFYNNAGLARKGLGENDRAIANFQKSISLSPSEDAPKTNLAQLYTTMADAASHYDHDLAETYYVEGLRAGSIDRTVLSVLNHNLAVLYKDMGRNDEAIPYFEQAVSLDGRQSSKKALAIIYTNKGVELFNSGRKIQARPYFLSAQMHDPYDADIRRNLNLTYQ